MPSATLTSKGQTTIPKEVRRLLNLHPGDRIEFFMQEDGGVVIKSASLNIKDLKGILLSKCSTPISIDEMNKAIRKRALGKLK